jgi:hypothetical protein
LKSEFIEDWVKIGFPAREKVLAEHPSLPLDEQCAICEKVIIIIFFTATFVFIVFSK